MNRSFCEQCLKKQQRIDQLTEENARLKRALNYRQRRANEGFFGCATPSSKFPIKANAAQEREEKKRGAKPGHPGAGRKAFQESEADRVVDVHGVPLGRIGEQIGIEPGSLVQLLHRVAHLLADVPPKLVQRYRGSPVKHADETGWRTRGKNGYAWLFATDKLSLFQFKKTRSGKGAQAVLGQRRRPGVLVVDRYAGYNKTPGKIQYC